MILMTTASGCCTGKKKKKKTFSSSSLPRLLLAFALLLPSCEAWWFTDRWYSRSLAVGTNSESEDAELDWSKALEGKNPECKDAELEMYEVAKPTSTEEARLLVQRANDLNLPICVKSGGHSYLCNHAQPNCLQIDLSNMKSAVVTTETAETLEGDNEGNNNKRYYLTFETGNLVGDLLKVAPESEYAFVHGECLTVGVGGYYLHGGVHLGWGTALYGMGGQNVREMEVVLANATVKTIDDPKLITSFTRAGSSFGLVTKIKLEIYKRPSPKAWFVPILSSDRTAKELEDVYETIWELRANGESDLFQVNLYAQTQQWPWSLLQITYLGTDVKSEWESLQRCVEFINQKMGIPVGVLAVILAKLMSTLMTDYGVGYHVVFSQAFPWIDWDPQPYTSSSFIVDGNVSSTLPMLRPYLEQSSRERSSHCFLVVAVTYLDETPLSLYDDSIFTALEYTCFGESRQLAVRMTEQLIRENPERTAYAVYYNTPNSQVSKCRYWPDYPELMQVKEHFDPTNRFDVYQGIHTSSSSVHDDGDCDYS